MSAFREAPRRLACPRCGEHLEPLSTGVEVCPRCEGAWLPTAAIEQAFGTPYWPKGPGAWWRRELECPACAVGNRSSMMTPVISGQIVVDRCPEHGEWLDPGELGRLLDAPRSLELEAFYERLRPDGELPARLLEFRKARQSEREQRAAELDEYRAKVEAEQARQRAEYEAVRAVERARAAKLAADERRLLLVDQRAALERTYEETERQGFAYERELAADRERITKQESQLAKLRDEVSKRERAIVDIRARMTELEGQVREINAELKAGPP